MKRLNTVVVVLLNIFFCSIALWIFTRNSYLRPFSGSLFKEFLSGILVLASIYANYFILYPKLYFKNRHTAYWLIVTLVSILIGIVDLAMAYSNIVLLNNQVIKIVGPFIFFSNILFLVIGRNFAVNLFSFLLRDRQHFQHSMENEVRIVYQNVRKIDVTDQDNNLQLIDVDDIFYCHQNKNFSEIAMVQNQKFYRLCSMKHLEQLLGEKDFIRITTNTIVPLKLIASCDKGSVIMKQLPWESKPTIFQLNTNKTEEVLKKVLDGDQKDCRVLKDKDTQKKSTRKIIKRKPIIPPTEKIQEIYSYVENHPNCNTADIVSEIEYSLSTIERCLAELKKQGLITHTGSKKTGGYYAVEKEG